MSTTTTSPAPATTGLKYTYREGEGYKDWYRANMGTEWDGTYLSGKPEGMSDTDWAQGMLIQQYESGAAAAGAQRDQTKQGLTDVYNRQTSAAQASYNAAANQYNQQMKSELEYAGVLHERMKKYLPQQMKAQGMGNMGVMQTAGANAVAKHISNRGAIIGQNQASMNELSRTYGERQAALDADYMKGMTSADATYNDRMTQLGDQRFADDMTLFGQTVEEKKAEQQQYYETGLTGIEEARTREEALALAEQMKPYVTEAQYQGLVTAANNRGNKLEGIAEEEAEEELEQKFDAANADLTTLYHSGASSTDLQAAFDQMKAAGMIDPEREIYWGSMIKLRQQDEADKAAGLVSAEQKDNADFGLMLLGEAATEEGRTDVLIQMAIWKGEGKITQTQYDEAVAYCRVLDGNADYLQKLEAGDKAAIEQAQLVDDICEYIVDTADNYDDAKAFLEKHSEGVELTEAQKRSIDIAMEMRKNMDEDDALLKMTEAQEAAYEQCVSMLGLCKTTAEQMEMLERYKDKLAPEVYEEFKMVLDYQAEDADVKREETAEAAGYESADEYDAAVLAGKEYVEYDGKQYKVNGEAVAYDGKLIENEAFLEALREKGFDNPNAKNIPNGTTLTFNVKPSKDGTFNWRDVLTILAGSVLAPAGAAGVGAGVGAGAGVNALLDYDMTLTYYNGSWYPVQTVEKK